MALTRLTTRDVAALRGISVRRVRQLIGEGKLRAQRMGRDWLITQRDAERVEIFGRPGRPVRNPSK